MKNKIIHLFLLLFKTLVTESTINYKINVKLSKQLCYNTILIQIKQSANKTYVVLTL
jgi:hypothetical protein